jgi:hypothetical protein
MTPALALLLAAFVQTERQPVEHGRIVYLPPAGWTRDEGNDGWFSGSAEERNCLFLWAEPAPAADGDLGKQFAPFQKKYEDWAKTKRVLREPAPMKLKSGLQASVTARLVAIDQGDGVTMEILVLAGGQLHYLLFVSGSLDLYKTVVAKHIEPMMDSVKERTIAPSPVAFGALTFVPPAGWKTHEGVWMPPDGKDDVTFLWVGPFADDGSPLAKQLEALQSKLEKWETVAILQSREAKLNVPAHFCARRVKTADGEMLAAEYLMRAGGELHYFLFAATSPQRFQAFAKDMDAMVKSVRAVEAKPEAKTGDWAAVGSLEYRPPADWKPAKGTYYRWFGYEPATAEPLDRQLRDLSRKYGLFVSSYDLAEGVEEKIELPIALPYAAFRKIGRYEFAGYVEERCHLEIAVRNGPDLHYFLFRSNSEAPFRQELEKTIVPMLRTIRARRWADAPESYTRPAPVKGRTIGRFCFSIEVPESWIEERKTADLMRFPALQSGGRQVTWPVVCEVLVGKPADPRAALKSWLQMRHGTLDSMWETEHHDLSDYRRWTFEDGSEGAIVALAHYGRIGHEGPLGRTAVSVGYLVHRNGCTLMIGSLFDFRPEWLRPAAEDEKAFEDFRKFLETVVAVGMNAKLDLPAAQEEWTTWLVRKKEYHYKTALSLNYAAGSTAFHSKEVRYTFHADRTVDVVRGEVTSISGRFYDPGGSGDFRVSGWGGDSSSRSNRNRFEVRGRRDDLWLVIYYRDGMSSFHPLEPDKRDGALRGLAIDGVIEGIR